MLADVVESMKNGIYKPISAYADDGIACLRMYNIEAGQIVWRDIKRIRLSGDERREFELRPGDLLVNRVNSRELVGKAAVIPSGLEPCVFESKNIRVRLRTDLVVPAFVSYRLQADGARYFTRNAQQVVGMASISQPQVGRFPLPLPALDEQQAIVAEIEKQFTRLDAGVAALKRAQGKLKRYRAAVLKAACQARLVETEAELARREGRHYETGSDLLARTLVERRQKWQGRRPYKEPASVGTKKAPHLPEGWTTASLEQLSFLDVGFAFKSAEFRKSGTRLLRGENIEPGALRWTDTRFWPNSRVHSFEHLLLRGGDIVLAMDRPLVSSGLKIARARPDDLPCLLVQRMARIRPLEVRMASYLFLALRTEAFVRHLLGGQTGTQLPHISGSRILAHAVPLPPLAEQTRIVAEAERRLSVVAEIEATVAANLQRATRLRQSILKQAFSGRASDPSRPTVN